MGGLGKAPDSAYNQCVVGNGDRHPHMIGIDVPVESAAHGLIVETVLRLRLQQRLDRTQGKSVEQDRHLLSPGFFLRVAGSHP